MEKLIDITGYAETYTDLCKMDAFPGEFYNVLEGFPFTTYRKTDETEISSLKEETDVIGWFPNIAELESNVTKPKDNDIYIVGADSPYTRKKAVVRGVEIHWEDDGEEEKKILKNYKTSTAIAKQKIEPEEGIYYSVGKEAPFELYGLCSAWEACGSYISLTAKKKSSLDRMRANPGEIAFTDGLFWLYTNNGSWRMLEIIEPIENVSKHTYKSKEKNYRLREGRQGGMLEWFEPRA